MRFETRSGAHATLTGLTADDHTQYALLAGRGTVQVLNGGTGAGDTLRLSSTADATKGDVRFEGNLLPHVTGVYAIGSSARKVTSVSSVGGIGIDANQPAYFINAAPTSRHYFNNAAGNKGFDYDISGLTVFKLWAATDQGAFFAIPLSADPANATNNGTFYTLENGSTDRILRTYNAADAAFEDVNHVYEGDGVDGATVTVAKNEYGNCFETWTATQNQTVNATNTGRAGSFMALLIENDATLPRVITFGTNFRSSGTLTGTINAGFLMLFISSGGKWCEVARGAKAI